MAYRIIYGKEKGSRPKAWGFCRFALTLSCFLLFLWAVGSFWPEGRTILQELLIPGDPEVTLDAAQVFARELSSGFPLGDAAANFCEAVLTYGASG